MARKHITEIEAAFVKDVLKGMSVGDSWIKNIFPYSSTEDPKNAKRVGHWLFNEKPAVVEFKNRLLTKLDDEATDVIGSLLSQLNKLEDLAEKAEESGNFTAAINARKELTRFREQSNMRKMNELEALAKLAERSSLPSEVVQKMATDIQAGPKL